MQNLSSPLVGLFDFQNYQEIVEALRHVLASSLGEIHERLFYEALEEGWNVSKAARSFGVTPHIFDYHMDRLYKETDAFLFELVVTHLNPCCIEIDRRVSLEIEKNFKDSENTRILAFGDGIGTDSLRVAAMGYEVTYFDLQGYTSTFAKHRFRRKGLDHYITVCTQIHEIPKDCFHAVICREVLEHVANPIDVISRIWDSLKLSGIALITESFGKIEPAFPTHLLSNKKYEGRTETLFVQEGFCALESYPGRRPMVFQKALRSDKSRFESLRHHQRYRFQDALRKLGGQMLKNIRF